MNGKIRITSRQKQIIMGKILGDGHLETTNDKTYRLKIEHSYKQKAYVDWLYQELKPLATGEPKIKEQSVKGVVYRKYWFNTRYTGSLRFYAQQFYENKRKIVPRSIGRWLTPLTMAVWFMDDGSIKSKAHRARLINTQGFSKSEVVNLMTAMLTKHNLHCKLRKQKEGWQIMIMATDAKSFTTLIKPHIHPSMDYKLEGLLD